MPACIKRTCCPFFRRPSIDADQDDDAEIRVVPAVDQHRLQRRGRVALGRRQILVTIASRMSANADPGLGRRQHRFGRIEADDVLDLLRTFSGSAAGRSILLMTGTIS